MVERARQEMGAKGVPAVPKSILQLMAWNISTLTFFYNHDVLTATLRLDGLLPNLFHKAFIEEDEAEEIGFTHPNFVLM